MMKQGLLAAFTTCLITHAMANSIVVDYSKLESDRDYYSDIEKNSAALTESVNKTKNIVTVTYNSQIDTLNTYHMTNAPIGNTSDDLSMAAFDFGFGLRLWNVEFMYTMTGLAWGTIDRLDLLPGSFIYPIFHPVNSDTYVLGEHHVPPGGVDNVYNVSESYSFLGYNDQNLTLGIGAYAVRPVSSEYDPYSDPATMNLIDFKLVVSKFGSSVSYNTSRKQPENFVLFYDSNIPDHPDIKVRPTYRFVSYEKGSQFGLDNLSWAYSDQIWFSMPIYWSFNSFIPDHLAPNISYEPLNFLRIYCYGFVYPNNSDLFGTELGLQCSLRFPWSSEIFTLIGSYSYNNKEISGNLVNIAPSTIQILVRLRIPTDIFPRKS